MPWASYVIAGDFIWLSGAEGRNPDKEQEYPDGTPDPEPMFAGIQAQTLSVLTKLADRVEEAGSSCENFIQFHFCLRNRTDWPAVQEVWREFWSERCPDLLERPRAAGMFITDVMMDRLEMLIDVWATAYLPPRSET